VNRWESVPLIPQKGEVLRCGNARVQVKKKKKKKGNNEGTDYRQNQAGCWAGRKRV